MYYDSAEFKMGVAFDVANLAFPKFRPVRQETETLKLQQQLLFDFVATKQLWTFIPDTVHQRRGGMNQQDVPASLLQ